MTAIDCKYEELDPGIRDVVQKIHTAGFQTTDSGDGVSKPKDWYESGDALPFPHVVVTTTLETMIADAHRLQDVVGSGWVVEVFYETLDHTTHLFTHTIFSKET